MFWHPRAEPFCVPAHQQQWQVPPNKVAVVNHGGAIYVHEPNANMTFNVESHPLWLRAGTRISFQRDIAGLLLPAEGT